jgi:hypothetical protein
MIGSSGDSVGTFEKSASSGKRRLTKLILVLSRKNGTREEALYFDPGVQCHSSVLTFWRPEERP